MVEVETIRGQLQIWNIYRPPAKGRLETRDAELHLENWLVNKNVIIGADVNTHGTWDIETETDTLGKEFNDWTPEKAYLPLNTGEPTRFRGQSRTTLDVTLVHGKQNVPL